MHRHTAALGAAALLLIGLSAAANLHAQSEIWRNDWFFSAPPTFGRAYVDQPAARTAFGANGDVLLAGLSYAQSEYQFVRLAADGALRWSANAGFNLSLDWIGPDVLIATDDGGALVAFGDSYDGFPDNVARIDASGGFAWMRQLPADLLVEDGPDRLVAAGCGGALTVVDRTSGDVIWQQAGVGRCAGPDTLAVDDAGGIYSVAFDTDEFRVIKHDAAGALVWNIGTGADTYASVSLVGVAGGVAYVHVANELRALHASDGSAYWTTDIGNYGALLGGSPAEPIVVGSDLIGRLAADTGIARWTVSLANEGRADLVGDALLVGTSSYAIARLDLATGSVAWTHTLPSQDAFGNSLQYFRFGGLASGTFSAVARPYAFTAAPPVVQRVAFASGATAGEMTVPSVPQGPWGSTIADGSDRALGVQSVWSSVGPVVRMHSLDASDGHERWAQSAALDLDEFLPYVPTSVSTDIARTGSAAAIAAACSVTGSATDPGYGALWLGLYDSDSGNPQWQSVIRDADQGATQSSAPVADPNGDLFVAVGAAVPCEPGGQGCGRQTLFKVSKTDGHVVWKFANATTTSGNYVYEQPFVIAGSDAIVSGPFDGALSSASLVSLAGTDGSSRWTSDVFGPYGAQIVLPAADGIFVLGAGWAKLDPATGATLWVGPSFATACSVACYSYDWGLLGNDDLLLVGEGDYKPQVTRLRGDGSLQYDTWQLPPNSPNVRSGATGVRRDSSGRTWLGIFRSNRAATGGLYVLAEFDPETGALLSQQILRDRTGDPLERITLSSLLFAPENNRMLLDERTTNAPDATPSGSVMLDTTITAHGDLATTLDVPSHAHAGQLLDFHARLVYAGDAPISAAHLNVYLPWASGARSVACTATNAGPCATDLASGNVRATIDLNPGAVVDVTGQVLVLALDNDRESAGVGAVAFGPVGLDEADTVNNLARAVVSQGLFADGFDDN
jgi:hypothetical protein